jgi:hypothetical protein
LRTERHHDPLVLALGALTATLSEPRWAQRFLNLTGIGTEELRARASDPVLLTALLRFLEAYEPDLVNVADELGVTPPELVEARRKLEEEMP